MYFFHLISFHHSQWKKGQDISCIVGACRYVTIYLTGCHHACCVVFEISDFGCIYMHFSSSSSSEMGSLEECVFL